MTSSRDIFSSPCRLRTVAVLFAVGFLAVCPRIAKGQVMEGSDDAVVGGVSIEERAALGQSQWQLSYIHQQSKQVAFRKDPFGNSVGQGYNYITDRLYAFHYELHRNSFWEAAARTSIHEHITAGHILHGSNTLSLGGGLLRWLDPEQRYRFRLSAAATKGLERDLSEVLLEARITRYNQGAGGELSAFSDRLSAGASFAASRDNSFDNSVWTLFLRDDNNLYIGRRKLQIGRVTPDEYPTLRLYSRNDLSVNSHNKSALRSAVGIAYRPTREWEAHGEIFGGTAIKGETPRKGFVAYLTRFF